MYISTVIKTKPGNSLPQVCILHIEPPNAEGFYIAGESRQQAEAAWRAETSMNRRNEWLPPELQPLLVGGPGTEIPETIFYAPHKWSSDEFEARHQQEAYKAAVAQAWALAQ